MLGDDPLPDDVEILPTAASLTQRASVRSVQTNLEAPTPPPPNVDPDEELARIRAKFSDLGDARSRVTLDEMSA
jgi:hypothetical protein